MNPRAVRILFLKDLFLCRRFLFAYLAGGILASAITCYPNATLSFIGFILVMTVAIAAGIHFIGHLLLAESSDQTRAFIMSMPVSLLDYSIGKISVVLTTFMIPWTAMFAISTICSFVLPWANHGTVAILPAIFLFLLSTFTIQLVTAVITDSVGWTICVMVACNVSLNVFLMKLFAVPEISVLNEGDLIYWPPVLLTVILLEVLVIIASLAIATAFQLRKRDLV